MQTFKSNIIKPLIVLLKNLRVKISLLNENTSNILDDNFSEKQDIFFSAVDNITARKFIGKKKYFTINQW